MAGLYIHVPFCKRRCIYCDFFSGTSLLQCERYISALEKEMDLFPDFFDHDRLSTVYFGGGTPSLLEMPQFNTIFKAVRDRWPVDKVQEITVECNPDDLTCDRLEGLRHLGVNRLSIGIQSLDDTMLRWMNRRHTAMEAVDAVHRAQDAGFGNISVDIIFGLPGQTLENIVATVSGVLQLGVQHISAYSLTVESRKLQRMVELGQVVLPSDDEYADMFQLISSSIVGAGFVQYEISNYALPGYESVHNSSYWHGVPYLGLGPAASSYDGVHRWSNICHTLRYCEGMESGHDLRLFETLSPDEHYNEAVFLALRTKAGIDLSGLSLRFGSERLACLLRQARKYIDGGYLQICDNHLALTRKGIFVSDSVMADLMA